MSAALWLLLLVLIGFAAALVIWPLARGSSAPPQEGDEDLSELGRLRRHRNALLRAIGDLDQEMERGNMEDTDYRRTRSRYVRQAALLLREIDGREQVLDEEIERAVARLRRVAGNGFAPSENDGVPHDREGSARDERG